ncbi:hypothetical protein ACVJF0_003739 [Bradyrhizobium elkanii]|nr:hypothetical protein [Bradyrhizobium elkanii]
MLHAQRSGLWHCHRAIQVRDLVPRPIEDAVQAGLFAQDRRGLVARAALAVASHQPHDKLRHRKLHKAAANSDAQAPRQDAIRPSGPADREAAGHVAGVRFAASFRLLDRSAKALHRDPEDRRSCLVRHEGAPRACPRSDASLALHRANWRQIAIARQAPHLAVFRRLDRHATARGPNVTSLHPDAVRHGDLSDFAQVLEGRRTSRAAPRGAILARRCPGRNRLRYANAAALSGSRLRLDRRARTCLRNAKGRHRHQELRHRLCEIGQGPHQYCVMAYHRCARPAFRQGARSGLRQSGHGRLLARLPARDQHASVRLPDVRRLRCLLPCHGGNQIAHGASHQVPERACC